MSMASENDVEPTEEPIEEPAEAEQQVASFFVEADEVCAFFSAARTA